MIVLWPLANPRAHTGRVLLSLLELSPVALGSLFVVGSFGWAPFALWLGWKRCKTRRSRAIYVVVVIIFLMYPARRYQSVIRLPLWSKFIEYFAVKVSLYSSHSLHAPCDRLGRGET
jgi:hypothetical protein